jgi:hypothetical protein
VIPKEISADQVQQNDTLEKRKSSNKLDRSTVEKSPV